MIDATEQSTMLSPPHSSLSGKSCKGRTQLNLTLASLVVSLRLLLSELLDSDLSLIDYVLRALLTQILSQTAVLASASVLDLGERVFGLLVQISFLLALSMCRTIQLTNELWVEGDHLWLQLVQQRLDFTFLALLGVLVEQNLEGVGIGFTSSGDNDA